MQRERRIKDQKMRVEKALKERYKNLPPKLISSQSDWSFESGKYRHKSKSPRKMARTKQIRRKNVQGLTQAMSNGQSATNVGTTVW